MDSEKLHRLAFAGKILTDLKLVRSFKPSIFSPIIDRSPPRRRWPSTVSFPADPAAMVHRRELLLLQ